MQAETHNQMAVSPCRAIYLDFLRIPIRDFAYLDFLLSETLGPIKRVDGKWIIIHILPIIQQDFFT